MPAVTNTLTDHSLLAKDALDARVETLRQFIEHCGHLLPAQGPIEVFVHHNTLHAFEEQSFHRAVKLGLSTYGGSPYFPERKYRELLESGRVSLNDVKTVLHDDLASGDASPIVGLGTRYSLRLAMMTHPLRTGPDAELQWVIAETDALRRFQPEVASLTREQTLNAVEQFVLVRLKQSLPSNSKDSSVLAQVLDELGGTPERWSDHRWEEFTLKWLWLVCHRGVRSAGNDRCQKSRPTRVRDVLLSATGEDTDYFVHDILIRFCSAFIDQDYADWELPARDQGLFSAFQSVFEQPTAIADPWLKGLPQEIRKLRYGQVTPLQSIAESLQILGVADEDCEDYVLASLLALRGWAGMVWQLESAADWVDRPVPKGSLVEFLAVRLILDRLAIEYVAREFLEFSGPLQHVVECASQKIDSPPDPFDQRAFEVFQIAQSLGWTPNQLEALQPAEWQELLNEIAAFDEVERCRIFHEAFERKYRIAALDAVSIQAQRCGTQEALAARPSFQIICCIDDREESFRRHLEEIDPACETFGAAGFFAVAINYLGAAGANYKPLCPIIITPRHFVKEDVGYNFEGVHQRRAVTRRTLGRFTHQVHARSRTFLGGVWTGLLGSLAAFPLVARVLLPRLTAQIRRLFGRLMQPPIVTQLILERHHAEPGPENGHVGYTVREMVDLVERLLRDLGLTKTFARLVVVTGHGSSSVNNPHESAYNCGACAGKRGGPNARAFAQMANDWRVRSELANRGIVIPEDTTFVGSYHNTCDDSVIWFDLDRLSPSHREDFSRTKQMIDAARLRNAHERCRRFQTASISLSPQEALRHVEGRAEDLSQVRPEYNHATNALCFVGRRKWSRSLFLDRRAFLTSYDPAQDDEKGTILLRILAAAIPVCAGINLEYYFSCVDPVVYGSGSKLPHNIAGLLGVMEGATSDLRTGLYQQMIEIHEPMRLLFVIETTPTIMLSLMDQHAGIGRLCRGEWVQLAVLDPQTAKVQFYRNGRFELHEISQTELPVVETSAEWYRGRRDHLDFAVIQASQQKAKK